MEQGQTNPRSHEPAAISPVHGQGQQCFTAPKNHLSHLQSSAGRRVTNLRGGSTQGQQVRFYFPAHSASTQGFIPEPAGNQQCMGSLQCFSCSLPPVTVCWALGKEQHWGLCCGSLSVVAELGEQEDMVPVPAPLGLAVPGASEQLKSRGEHSATSCRAQRAQGHHSGPVGR